MNGNWILSVFSSLCLCVSAVQPSPAQTKLDIPPDVIPAAALHNKLQNEIKNWTRFIDAKGIKAE